MESELIPAAVALGGGGAALAAIYAHERAREEAMRRSRVRYEVTFPGGASPAAAISALAGLSGSRTGTEFIFEVRGRAGEITHAIAVPEASSDNVSAGLASALPGLRLRQVGAGPDSQTTLVLRVFVPVRSLLRTDDPVGSGRGLLFALARLAQDEQVVVRWALRATVAPRPAGRNVDRPEVRELVRALRQRATEPGFGVSGLILIRTGSLSRTRQIAEHISAMLRSRRGRGHELRVSSARGRRTLASLPRVGRSSGWLSVAELLPLLGWPLGDDLIEGVRIGVSRQLRAGRDLAREGRRLFVGQDAQGERPIALSPRAALLHSLIIGPTGTGKSTVIARGVLNDLEHGFGGVVIDPKHDLVETLLDRVPKAHADRVVVLDPAADRPVGLNLLGSGDPDLRSDIVLSALRSIFRDAWGPRTEYYCRLALRTLGEMPGATLTDFGRLFAEHAFRRSAISRLSDPVAVSAWQAFESLTPAEQVQHVQAPLSRVMTLISRPALRAVLAQPAPKLDIGALLAERRWLFASLAPGTLGEPAARLLGAVLSFLVWTALEARVALPPAKRVPVFLVFDELQALTELPLSIERIAERARGLGGGLVVGTQTLGRLPESTRHALLGNLATLVVFRTGADESRRLARELPGLTPRDLQALGPFEVAARVAGEAGSVSVATGHTEPLGPPVGLADLIRQHTAERYGADRRDIDEQLRGRHQSPDDPGSAGVGRGRRPS